MTNLLKCHFELYSEREDIGSQNRPSHVLGVNQKLRTASAVSALDILEAHLGGLVRADRPSVFVNLISKEITR